jgi:hypothetical protein
MRVGGKTFTLIQDIGELSMRLVESGEKGINVRLSDQCQEKIFTDATEDGKDVVIVKGRVVRVDSPSARMGIALNQEIPGPTGKGKAYTLLVETKDEPTVITEPLNAQLQKADKEQQKAILEAEAKRLGFVLGDAPVDEGDASSLSNKKTIAGQVDKTDPSDGKK